MDERIIIDLDRETLKALDRQARAHGHSVADEVREIVQQSVRMPLSSEEFIRRAEAIAAMTPKDVQQTDSAILVRQDRDR